MNEARGEGGLGARFGALGEALTSLTMRWVPDAWVVAVLLTVGVWALAVVLAGAPPWTGEVPAPACVADARCGAFDAWSAGVWKLLALSGQFALALVAAQAVATSRPIHRLMLRLAAVPSPERPRQAIVLMALFSASTAWANWAVNLVMCAAFAPIVAARNPRVDFRLLVATAYLGLGAVWHAGLSGSAPLIAATADSFLIKQGLLHEPLAISATLFAPFNLAYLVAIVTTTTAAAALLHPSPERAQPLDRARAEALIAAGTAPATPATTPAQRLDHSRLLSALIGCALLAHLGLRLLREGSGGWDINGYNAAFVGAALLLHDSPRSFLEGCEQGARNAWGVIVQFPLYAGIFGLITATALGAELTALLEGAGDASTYPLLVYVVSAAMNYLVPSGGSQWVLEAPAILRAGAALGVPHATTTMAFAYGDMSTNLIQPFWAIPLLSVTGVRFGEIMGYCTLLFAVVVAVTLVAVAWMPTALP
jgi:short-chain fatty acids transporter